MQRQKRRRVEGTKAPEVRDGIPKNHTSPLCAILHLNLYSRQFNQLCSKRIGLGLSIHIIHSTMHLVPVDHLRRCCHKCPQQPAHNILHHNNLLRSHNLLSHSQPTMRHRAPCSLGCLRCVAAVSTGKAIAVSTRHNAVINNTGHCNGHCVPPHAAGGSTHCFP